MLARFRGAKPGHGVTCKLLYWLCKGCQVIGRPARLRNVVIAEQAEIVWHP